MSVKFPFLGGCLGGGECRFYFYGRVDFSDLGKISEHFHEKIRASKKYISCQLRSAEVQPDILLVCWEKLNRGVSKPGCFPLFSGKVRIVSRTFSGLFLVGALNRPTKRKRTNRENPRTIPEQIGKIPEKSGKSQKGQKRTKKEGQVQIGKPPRLKPPRLAALESGFNSGANADLDGPAIRNANRGIRVNRLARIDSQINPYFHDARAIRANRLKPAICNV